MSMQTKRRHVHAGGYSLVELAVALAIASVIGLALWQLVPRFMSLPMVARLTAPPMAGAEDAINGFILANGRLPCVDVDGDGLEDCGAAVTATGWLPARSIGLYLQPLMRYGVYRASNATVTADADLATARDRYQPLLPNASSALTNGLDFCAALLTAMRAPGVALTAGAQRIPIAYGLALPGNIGGVNQFGGLNAVAGQFEQAGTARNANYQDETRTVGLGELFGKIGCVRQLAAANGAARAAFAAQDSARVAAAYEDFRDFAVGVRKLNRDMAIVGVALATADEADAIATSATAIALTAISAGSMAGTVAAAAIGITTATAALAAAIASVVTSEQSLQKAQQQLTAASSYRAAAATDAAAALQRAMLQDQKGLLR